MSYNAYRQAQSTTASPRNAEYRVFSDVTAKLIAIENDGRDNLKPLVEAVNDNRILWGTLADDCASERNLLPADTRAAIISLHHFVQSYSRSVIRKRETAQPLIDINRMIMDGLAGREVVTAQ